MMIVTDTLTAGLTPTMMSGTAGPARWRPRSPPFTQGGSGNVYDITLTNTGFAATTGSVSFSVTLPAGVRAVAMSGAGWSCDLAGASCRTNPGVTLAVGQQDQLTLRVAVPTGAPVDLQTLMQASGGGERSRRPTSMRTTTTAP